MQRRPNGKPRVVPDDPALIRHARQGVKPNLTAWGDGSDRKLAEAVAMVQRSFRGARLVEVRNLQDAAMAACE